MANNTPEVGKKFQSKEHNYIVTVTDISDDNETIIATINSEPVKYSARLFNTLFKKFWG